MLGAMAKRTLQMTKGIESFSALEQGIDQGLTNQLMLQEMLPPMKLPWWHLISSCRHRWVSESPRASVKTQQTLRTQLQTQAETSRLLEQVDRAMESEQQSSVVGSLNGIGATDGIKRTFKGR